MSINDTKGIIYNYKAMLQHRVSRYLFDFASLFQDTTTKTQDTTTKTQDSGIYLLYCMSSQICNQISDF